MIFRFLQGFSHVFTYVYFPTWVDQFGLQHYKTIMTSFIQTASPFGSVFGFNCTTFLGDFKYGFALLAVVILPLDFVLLFMPEKFFSPKIFDSREVEITEYTYAIHHYQNSWFSPKAKAYYRTRALFVKLFGRTLVHKTEKFLMPWKFK